jgi:GTP-binding protein LepA
VHKDDAYHKGQALVSKLKEFIPQQLFVIPIQAYSQGRVISRANVKALRKDVAGEMLRRRYHPQEKAAGKTKKRQKTHEDGRERGNSAGSVHGYS